MLHSIDNPNSGYISDEIAVKLAMNRERAAHGSQAVIQSCQTYLHREDFMKRNAPDSHQLEKLETKLRVLNDFTGF